MIRVDLNLEDAGDLQEAKAQWKFALGLVPGEPNEGLTARRGAIPARLADYDDSSWEVCENIQEERSGGLTFGWYRITVTIPEKVHGVYISGSSAYFETCIDDYGEVWVNGECDSAHGMVTGYNVPHRVALARGVQPGDVYVIACLAINGPLGDPGGTIFVRYARIGFEMF